MPEITVKELILYPVKSCGGISLNAAEATPLGLASVSGLVRDRTWVVIRPNGKFITQRQKPKMALIKTRIEPQEALYDKEFDPSHAALVFSAPDVADLHVPLVHQGEKKVVPVTVWDWNGQGMEESQEAEQWFTTVLGVPARLARYAGSGAVGGGGDAQAAGGQWYSRLLGAGARMIGKGDTAQAADPNLPFDREVSEDWVEKSSAPVAFADQFPFLVGSLDSLADLNANLSTPPVPINRFRANVIISGAPAWDEDSWQTVTIGTGATFDLPKPCSRCKMPSIDQDTGVEGEEPGATLYKMRLGNDLGWGETPVFKQAVFFGTNMVLHPDKVGVLKVGDQLQVVARREGPPRMRGIEYTS